MAEHDPWVKNTGTGFFIDGEELYRIKSGGKQWDNRWGDPNDAKKNQYVANLMYEWDAHDKGILPGPARRYIFRSPTPTTPAVDWSNLNSIAGGDIGNSGTNQIITQPSTGNNSNNGGYGIDLPKGLDLESVLSSINQPLDANIDSIVAPQYKVLQDNLNRQEAQNRSNAQSTFMQRGLTGSSSELGALTRDIPGQTQQALATGYAGLVAGAAPIAQRQNEANLQARLSLRNMITDEQFNSMSMEQKDRLAQQDQQLQLALKQLDMKYGIALEQARQAFEAAENDTDRGIASEQSEKLRRARKDESDRALTVAYMQTVAKFLGGAIGGGF
jgi:hypothetical protein